MPEVPHDKKKFIVGRKSTLQVCLTHCSVEEFLVEFKGVDKERNV
jgi:hypothetical protein